MSETGQPSHDSATMAGDPDRARKQSLPRRLGCWLLIALWFILLSTPCGLFYLAANGEIRLEHRQVPDTHAHPRLLISLVSESDDRGLRIERSTTQAGASESELCVETTVTFVLWESSGGNQNVQFCDCYLRSGEASAWKLKSTYGAACMQAG